MRVGLLLNRAQRRDPKDLVFLLESHASRLNHRRQQNYLRGICGLTAGEIWKALTPADRIRILLPKFITPLMALDLGMFFGVTPEDILLEHGKDLLEMHRKDAELMEILRRRHKPACKAPVVTTTNNVAAVMP